MIAPDPVPLAHSGPRLIDTWRARNTRDGAAVVAEHWSRAPAWLRLQVRPLCDLERRFWFHLSDRAWMGTEVFAQVPLYLPGQELGWVLSFFVPAFDAAIELDAFDPLTMHGGELAAHLERCAARDDPLREHGRIVTIRCPRSSVRRDPRLVAESVRYDLGLP